MYRNQVNDSNITKMEMERIKMNLVAVNRQFSEKKAELQEKEDEVRSLTQEKSSLTADLTESKREIHSLATFQTKLENDLRNRESQLEAEQARITQVGIYNNYYNVK